MHFLYTKNLFYRVRIYNSLSWTPPLVDFGRYQMKAIEMMNKYIPNRTFNWLSGSKYIEKKWQFYKKKMQFTDVFVATDKYKSIKKKI